MTRDSKYDDILRLSRPDSPGHPRLSALSRAAQFAPFAALAGYEDAIDEAGRLTEARRELSQEEISAINRQLQRVKQRIRQRPRVYATCFEQDATKAGGRYVTLVGTARKIFETEGFLQLEDGTRICFSDILDLTLDEPENAKKET